MAHRHKKIQKDVKNYVLNWIKDGLKTGYHEDWPIFWVPDPWREEQVFLCVA